MRSNNENLAKARTVKNNEFYTQLKDIESELSHYEDQLRDKIIYCNCDKPTSNFCIYFYENFVRLGIKKLIATYYKEDGQVYKMEYDSVNTSFKPLNGNGDFRNDECVKLLQEADIVITNPPFSLFREFVSQLVSYGKKYLIVGSQNSITYKDIFQLIKIDEIWLGYTYPKEFMQPDGTIKKFGNICWYTNLEVSKRRKFISLTKSYSENQEDYPLYDNYAAFDVSKTKNIPYDYEGVFGVPISFLNVYCPDQFEILGKTNSREHAGSYLLGDEPTAMINGKKMYHRILIRKR
jgi:hypothetical protein